MTTSGPGETAGPPSPEVFTQRRGRGEPEPFDLPVEFDGDSAVFTLGDLIARAQRDNLGLHDTVNIQIPPRAVVHLDEAGNPLDAEDSATRTAYLNNRLVINRGDAEARFDDQLLTRPKFYGVLTMLLDRSGIWVSATEIKEGVWGDAPVNINVVHLAIHGLRKWVGDLSHTIENKPGFYRFNEFAKSPEASVGS